MTWDIAARANACQWEDMPENARHAARICLADGLAVMLGALRYEPGVQPFQTQARSYGTGPSSILSGGKAAAPAAAFANGALSHALDFEDTFDPVGLHVNAAIIPTVLALAEAAERTFCELLTAMALGADLACRIGLSLTTDPAKRGWYFPPMIGAIGAALAGAKLLRLNEDQIVSALSLTQVQFALTDALKRSPDSDLRAVRDGFAARAATEAVLLAQSGVVGTNDPLSEDGGLVRLLTGAAPDTSHFTDFATTFLTPELSLKLWPCCRGTHPAIALALDLRAEGISAKDINLIAFAVEPPDDMLFEPRIHRIRPANAISAKFSIPYCFAHAMLHGAPSLQSFADNARQHPDTLALAEKVMLRSVGTAKPTAWLEMCDGRTSKRPLPPAPVLKSGEATFASLTQKMRDCVGTSPVLDALLSLETADLSLPVTSLMDSIGTA